MFSDVSKTLKKQTPAGGHIELPISMNQVITIPQKKQSLTSIFLKPMDRCSGVCIQKEAS
jgi:hypothetical protein